jgi:hypothetical protein
MSRIIKEPFAPRRRHLMTDYRRELLKMDYRRENGLSFFSRLKGSLVGINKLAEVSLDDLCITVLLVSLLVTTLLLPWIVV